MSSLNELWETLRKAGLQETAPLLVQHGIRSINQLALSYEPLAAAGLRRWQFEAILATSSQSAEASVEGSTGFQSRGDVPGIVVGKRANIQAALEAAAPNQRQRSLQLLDADILSKTTNPANDARVRTYLAVCRVWEVTAWPLNTTNVRCFGASLKAGHYRSVQVYYQAICGYQQRVLRTEIPTMVRQCIKDCIRSVLRGLGVSQLKDSFNGMLVGSIQPSDDAEAFSFDNIRHCRDMVVIGLWYMLREVEMANSRAGDLQLNGNEVSLTVPLHKTDPHGKFTQRTLSCSCGTTAHNMCAWHAAERHLMRLEAFPGRAQMNSFPLFPDPDGHIAAKQQFISSFRMVIAATGTPVVREGPLGVPIQRFHGHCLRVTGAQMLSAAGVELSLIQLLGRWTSSSVLRYTQDSALVRVPQIPNQVLRPEETSNRVEVRIDAASSAPMTPGPVPGTPARLVTARPKAAASAERGLRAELQQLREAIAPPDETFVFRPRAKILHRASRFESTNEPNTWRTSCGWAYGTSTFLRTQCVQDGTRKCRKCFDLGDSSSSDSSESSDITGLEDSSQEDDEF